MQYASRALWDSLESVDASPALADSFKTVEYILSTFRKRKSCDLNFKLLSNLIFSIYYVVLRFGRCVDIFYSSLRTIHYPDLTIRVTLTLSKLSQSLFLLADHFMWLARTGLFKGINTNRWGKFANKYWLLSIIMNLCRDVYEIFQLIDLHKAGTKSGITRASPKISPLHVNSLRDFNRLALHSYALVLGHKDVAVDTVKNLCDLFIPLTALGYTRLSPRTIGLLGAISSAAGLWALLEPTAKLTPA